MVDLFGAPEFSIGAQVAELRRELAMRERCYPGWVSKGTMKKDAADRQVGALRAAIATLEALSPSYARLT